MRPAGVDRASNKIWHYGPTTRVYRQDSTGKWTIVCSTFEELNAYVEGLYPIGAEWSLKAYLKDKVLPQVVMERLRKQEEERAELARLQREEQIRQEKQRLLEMGPRRSRRSRGSATYAENEEDSDDTEYDYQSSVSSKENHEEPERRSGRLSKVVTESEEDDPLTA
jgi:hypothetical protein